MEKENRLEYCFNWRIENYSVGIRNHKDSIKSPIFSPDNCGSSKWYLEFYPLGKKSKKFASCFLCRSEEDLATDEISIAFKIEILNDNNSEKTVAALAMRENSSKCEFKRGTQLGWDDIELSKWKKNYLTIKCRMIRFFPAASEAVTEIGVDRCSFKWTVNCNVCLASCVSRKFAFSENLEYEISITSPNEEIEIKICKSEADKTPAILCGKISLLNNQGGKDTSETVMHIFDASDEDKTWNYPFFIDKYELEEEDNEYMEDDCFSLLCEFSKANGTEQVRTSNSIGNPLITKVNNVVTLHSDLKNIFSNMKHSDVELRTENVSLPAHKFFLSARSPVFSAMFDQDMIENKLNVVDIPDASAETLKSFLEFIYTGSVKFQDCASALKLLLMAEKYQVLSLKETCSEYLVPVISVENACEILSVADVVNLEQLKKCTMDYIARHASELWMSSEWSEFIKNSGELSTEIFSYFATHFALTPKEK